MLTSPLLKLRQSVAPNYVTLAEPVSQDPRWRSRSIASVEIAKPANQNLLTTVERLELRYAACKRELSQVSMHLSPEFRSRTLQQLRNLLNPKEWDEDDELISVGSFKSFVRAMALLQPKVRPMLGLANSGNVLAMWSVDHDQTTFEHLDDDRVRWFVSVKQPEGPESAAGVTNVYRLGEIVEVQGIRALIDGAG